MTTILICAVLLSIILAFWFGRKGGKDSAKRKATEKTLEQVVDANRPAESSELERVRDKYRRD